MRNHIYKFLSIIAFIVVLVLISVPLDTLAQSPTIGGCQIFPANSIFNTPIDGLPVHPMSSTYIANMGGTSQRLKADFGEGVWPPGSNRPIGIPFFTVDNTQPDIPVTFGYDDESDPGPYPIPLSAPIEGGPDSDGDRHVIAINTDDCMLYEMYYAFPQASSWEAGSGAVFDLNSNELHPDTWTSADAAGLPIMPLLVRRDEVVAGEINHAIRITASCTHNSYVWPARHRAGSCNANYPPMGMRFRLRADFPIQNFSQDMQVILRAMQIYGVILADNGSNWYISGEPNEDWDNDILREFNNVRAGDFVAVDQSPLMVDYDSGETPPRPQTPTGLTVNGSLTTYPPSPSFQWTNDPNTTQYQLVIKNGNTTVLNQWYEVGADITCTSTCTVTPTFAPALLNATYSWYVQPYNEAHGAGPLSSRSNTAQFSVAIPAPAKPSGLTTVGSLTTAPVTPQFQWSHDGVTTWYQVQVTRNGVSVLDNWYQVSIGNITCTSTCTITPGIELVNGNYQWIVTPWAEWSGTGTASNTANFTVNVPPPSQPVSLTVLGSLTTPPVTPQFQWAHDGTSSWYQLNVVKNGAIVINRWFGVSGLSCTSTCTVSPGTTLSNGDYDWWVLGWNTTHGNGIWSTQADFTVNVPGAIEPTGLVTSGSLTTPPVQPTYTWTHDPNSTYYLVYLNRGATVIFQTWYQVGAQVTCTTTCSITPTGALANGNYTWWVRGWNTVGNGPWSAEANFSVAVPAPTTPTGLVTSGSLTTSPVQPTYTWNHDPNSTWYFVQLNRGATLIFQTWYQVGAGLTCTTTCSLSPTASLANGDYTWWVRGWNTVGNGSWSVGANFTVNVPPPPPAVAPTGLIVTGDLIVPSIVVLNWNHNSANTWYEVYVSSGATLLLNQWYAVGDATINCTTVCALDLNGQGLALGAGTYQWWIRAYNGTSGNTSWVQGANFTITNAP